MVVLPVGHPLAGADSVTPADLPSDAWINTAVDVRDLAASPVDGDRGSGHRLDFDGMDFRTALNLVAAGLGVALLPRLLLLDAPPSVVVLPMRQPTLVRRLYTCRLDTQRRDRIDQAAGDVPAGGSGGTLKHRTDPRRSTTEQCDRHPLRPARCHDCTKNRGRDGSDAVRSRETVKAARSVGLAAGGDGCDTTSAVTGRHDAHACERGRSGSLRLGPPPGDAAMAPGRSPGKGDPDPAPPASRPRASSDKQSVPYDGKVFNHASTAGRSRRGRTAPPGSPPAASSSRHGRRRLRPGAGPSGRAAVRAGRRALRRGARVDASRRGRGRRAAAASTDCDARAQRRRPALRDADLRRPRSRPAPTTSTWRCRCPARTRTRPYDE